MKLILINNSDDTFTYGDVIVGPQSSLNVSQASWYPLYRDIGFIADLRKNNIYINDGDRDYHLENAETYLQKLIDNGTGKDISGSGLVTTQYEKNDKDLKLCRVKGVLSESNSVKMSIKVPGTPGVDTGRYVAGGYAISGDFDPDDYIVVNVEDIDRLVAWAIALQLDPEAVEPVADEVVAGMGEIPGFGAFPSYPIVKSYTDDELPTENQGWYFWPMRTSTGTMGECEVEPIGGYGHLPPGFYLTMTYIRPAELTTGSCRINVYWGKLG